jgi:hypothetical protein
MLSDVPVAAAVAAGLGCLIVYLLVRVFHRPDFGVPVRRRLLRRGLRVRRDQFAEVPIWWSNLQVRRALTSHWKQSLRRNAGRSASA